MDDGDTVSIAGCGRAGYWCKNTLVLCIVPGSRVLLSCRNGGVIWTGFCVIYCSEPGSSCGQIAEDGFGGSAD